MRITYLHPTSGWSLNTSAPLIALLEDYAPLQSVLVELLTNEGYRVVCYSDADSLFADLHVAPPALIVLDLHLGSTLGGWPILGTLRQNHDTTLLPILLMADVIFAHRHAARIRRPHVAVQAKPLDLNHLLAHVAQIHRAARASDHHGAAIIP
jgi:two-component system, OmpR family, response regulator MprA